MKTNGGFAKWQQRAPNQGQNFMTGKQMIDLGFIRDFMRLNDTEKMELFQNGNIESEYSYESINSILNSEHFL